MAEETVGLLRVVLASNSAQFVTGMEQASASVSSFDKTATKAGAGVASFGTSAQGATESTGLLSGAVGRLAAGFTAALVVDRVISSVISFGREAFTSAGQITDLASKTGLTMRSIQEMEAAAKQTGTTLQAFTTASFQLGVRLAGGSDSVVAAVQALGLSYRELKAQSPDEQFRVITERLGEVQSAQERNKLAVELFGRSAKDVLPAIAQGYREIADSAVIAGDQQLLALDMASDALDSFYNSAKNVTIQLAGGLVIAARETWRTFKEGMDQALAPFAAAWQHATDAMEAWGLKAQEIQKVHGPASAGLKDTTQAAKALTMSWEEMNTIADKLTASVGKKTTVTRTYTQALRELAPAVQAVQGPSESLLFLESRSIQDTARLSQELERWARINGATLAPSIRQVNGVLGEQVELVNRATHEWVPFKQSVDQAGDQTEESAKQAGVFAVAWGDTMEQLPDVIINAIQRGTSAIRAAGSLIGTNMMGAFVEKFGPAIEAALPFGLGRAVNALLPRIGSLLGPLAQRIAGFFRNFFGGPSGEELTGRAQVAEFEESLHSALSAGQEAESQGEDWRRTVIAIRDAYIAAGRSQEEALRDAERLWESSRDGGEDALAVIEEIKRKMRELTSGEHTIEIGVEYRTSAPPGATRPGDPESHTQPVDPGFATGTMGRFGGWFRDFKKGFPTRLHGIEAVVPKQDAPAFAREVLAAEGPPGGGGVAVLPVIMGADRSPRDIARDAINHLAKSGLPTNESGIASAIEAVIDNWFLTYSRG